MIFSHCNSILMYLITLLKYIYIFFISSYTMITLEEVHLVNVNENTQDTEGDINRDIQFVRCKKKSLIKFCASLN